MVLWNSSFWKDVTESAYDALAEAQKLSDSIDAAKDIIEKIEGMVAVMEEQDKIRKDLKTFDRKTRTLALVKYYESRRLITKYWKKYVDQKDRILERFESLRDELKDFPT